MFIEPRHNFGKAAQLVALLAQPVDSSVRLMTNAEKMVLRETQPAFVYFSLHGITVDAIIVNRILPCEVVDSWFKEWHIS